MQTFKFVKFSSIFIIAASFLTYVLLSFINLGTDEFLLGSYFSLHEDREVPKKVSLIVVTDEDYGPPLRLDVKYPPKAEIIVTILEKVLLASPELILIDSDNLPAVDKSEASEKLSALLKSTKIKDYKDKILELNEYPSKDVKDDPSANEANILRYHGLVTFMPQETLMFNLNDNKVNHYVNQEINFINYYGSSKDKPFTLYNFTELLAANTTDKSFIDNFKDRIVFVGRQSDNYFKGTAENRLLLTPVYPAAMSSIEIQATILSNFLDGSYLRSVPRTYVFALAILVILILIILTNLPHYWQSVAGLTLFSSCIYIVIFKFVFLRNLWGRDISLLILLPLSVLILKATMWLITAKRTYNQSRKDSFLD